jgi:outer membrane protein assembly factor BamB
MKSSSIVRLLALSFWCSFSVSAQPPGSELWDFKAEPREVTDPGTGGKLLLVPYIFSSPAISEDGAVHFGSANGEFYCLNPDGSLRWSYTTDAEVQSSPAIADDGTIHFGSVDGKLYALRPDGTLRWAFQTGDYILSSPAIGRDGVVYIGSRDAHLYAVNPDGSEKWRFETGRQVDSAPVIGLDGTIYIGSSDGNLYALNRDGTEKWRFTYTSGPAGGMGVAVSIGSGATIYACTAGDENTLYALRPADGSILWSFAFGSATALVHPVVPVIGHRGTLYLGTPDRKFYAINRDGTKEWELDTGTAGHSTAALGKDGLIYVNTWDLKTLALSPEGTVEWEFPMEGPAVGGLFAAIPTLTADGVMYVGSGNGRLYAIRASSGFANSPWPMFGRNTRHTANVSSALIRPPEMRIERAEASMDLKLIVLGEPGVQLDVEYTTDLTRWEKLTEVTATGDWSEMQIPFEQSGIAFFRLVFPESGVSF